LLADIGSGEYRDEFLSGEEAIRSEYKDSFRSGVRMRISPASGFQVGLGVAHTHADGDPGYNYKITHTGGGIDSTRDVPTDSDLKVLAIELQIGGYAPLGGSRGRSYFYAGMGPTLYRVEESASMDFLEFKDDSVVRQGRRREELVKWRIGADLRLELGYVLFDKMPIGVATQFSFISWKAEKDKSLTLDWIDQDYFAVMSFSLTLGYSFY
jgi:hypothetical protein